MEVSAFSECFLFFIIVTFSFDNYFFILYDTGDEGRTALEQAQLGAHGFQGVNIKI